MHPTIKAIYVLFGIIITMVRVQLSSFSLKSLRRLRKSSYKSKSCNKAQVLQAEIFASRVSIVLIDHVTHPAPVLFLLTMSYTNNQKQQKTRLISRR